MRRDIQALRAFAVLSVVAFHAGLPGMDAGYLGVDIFFVISGYLIIGMLARELSDTGSIRLVPFFARRARRLLPAASLVLVATVVMTVLVMPGLAGQRVFEDVESAAAYVANLHFALIQMDYWQPVMLSPVIHFWSLGVEEQFYVFFPLMLALTPLLSKRINSHSRILMIQLSLIFAVSLGFMLQQNHSAAAWAFYGPWCRAWEFAIGGLMVLLGTFAGNSKQSLHLALRTVSTAALIGLVIGAGKLHLTSTYTQLMATVLVAILLLTGTGMQGATNWLERCFAISPVQWIGTVSYSIYLWHWPVLYFGANLFRPGTFRPDWLTYQQRIILILCTFVFAYIAYRFVEDPLRRHSSLVSSPRRSLILGLTLSLSVAGLAWSASHFAPGRMSATPIVDVTHAKTVKIENEPNVAGAIARLAPAPLVGDRATISHQKLDAAAGSLPPKETEHCLAQDSRGQLPKNCYFGQSARGRVVALVGSSHAYQFYSPMLAVAQAAHAQLLLETRAGCSILPGVEFIAEDAGTSNTGACVIWQRKVIESLLQTKPAVITIVTGRSKLIDPVTGKVATAARRFAITTKSLASLVTVLEPTKSKLVFIRETPMQTYDPVMCLSAHTVLACRQPLAPALLPRQMSLPDTTSPKVVTLDLSLALCDAKLCPAVRHGMVVWRDRHHITNEYAQSLSPLFRELFSPIVSTATRASGTHQVN